MPINPISNQILEALEQGSQIFSSFSSEAREQFQALLDAQLDRMDVVSRAEFDALRNSLDRANQRLEELEAQLNKASG